MVPHPRGEGRTYHVAAQGSAVGKYTQCAGCESVSGATMCLTHQAFCVASNNYCGTKPNNALVCHDGICGLVPIIPNPNCHCCSGQFLNVTINTRHCVPCPSFQYVDQNAHILTECKNCLEGLWPTTMSGTDLTSALVPTTLGLADHGAIECVGAAGAIMCSSCSAGKYKVNAGMGGCSTCQAGKYSTVVGAISEASCVACALNSNSAAGSSFCTTTTTPAPTTTTPAPTTPYSVESEKRPTMRQKRPALNRSTRS